MPDEEIKTLHTELVGGDPLHQLAAAERLGQLGAAGTDVLEEVARNATATVEARIIALRAIPVEQRVEDTVGLFLRAEDPTLQYVGLVQSVQRNLATLVPLIRLLIDSSAEVQGLEETIVVGTVANEATNVLLGHAPADAFRWT